MKSLFFVLALVASTAAGPINLEATQCAKTCSGNEKFKYQTGKTYDYEYDAVLSTRLQGASEEQSGMHIAATASFEVLAPCELVLKLKEVRLEKLHPSDPSRRITDSNNDAFKEALEARPLRFSYQDGRLDDVCASENEPAWVLNVKRGVLTSFQVSAEHLEHDHRVIERDVTGTCQTDLKVTPGWRSVTITKQKNLLGCTDRSNYMSAIQSMPYKVDSDIQSLPLLKSTHDCEHTINKAGYLTKSECSESHVFRPFSTQESGAMTSATHSLTFKREVAGTTYISAVDGATKRTTLLFDHEKTDESGQSNNIAGVEETLNKICENKDVRSETPRLFNELIYRMRDLSVDEIVRLHAKLHNNDICRQNHKVAIKFFHDAVPMVGTAASVRVISQAVTENHLKGIDNEAWLASLAFVQSVTHDMVREVKPLLEMSPMKRTAMLPASAMISSYCRSVGNCESDSLIVSIVDGLKRKLGSNCNVDGDEILLMTLKALANIGVTSSSLNVISGCAANLESSVEVRLQALKVLQELSCSLSRNDAAMTLFGDVNEDSEVRIAAYLAVMACPDPDTLTGVFNMLKSEPVNQVGSFVWTHLTNLAETSDPFKQDLRTILQDEVLQKEFNLDNRKFSRNYEGSVFVNSLNAGAKVESNLVWSQGGYVPRSASLNLTTDLFGHSVNLLEVGGRAEGVENLLESLFGPEGYFPDNPVATALQRTKRAVKESKLNSVHDSFNVEDAEKELKGSVYLKMFGNELSYMNLDDSMVRKVKDTLNPLEMMINLAEGGTIDYSKSYMFLDTTVSIPTIAGIPLRLAINGTATVTLQIGGKLDLARVASWPTDLDINGYVKPSAALEISSTMTMDAFLSRAGLKMVHTQHTSTHADVLLKVKDNQLLNAKVNMPRDKIELLDIQTKFFVIHGSEEREQKMVEAGRIEEKACTGTGLMKTLGLQLCGELSYPNATLNPDAPYFPFTGPLVAKVELDKLDTHTSYELQAHVEAVRSTRRGPVEKYVAKFGVNTPGSRIDRELLLDFEADLVNKKLTTDIRSPWKKAQINGEIINNDGLKKAELQFSTDDDFTVRFLSQLKTETLTSGRKYVPRVEVQLPGRPTITLSGFYTTEAKDHLNEVYLSLENLTDEPITVNGKLTGETSATFVRLESTMNIKNPLFTVKGVAGVDLKPGTWLTKSEVMYKYGTVNEKVTFNSKVKSIHTDKAYRKVLHIDFQPTQFPVATLLLDMEHGTSQQGDMSSSIDLQYGTSKTNHVFLSHSGSVDADKYTFKTSHEIKTIIRPLDIEIDGKLDHRHSKREVITKVQILPAKRVSYDAALNFQLPSTKPIQASLDVSLNYPGRRAFLRERFSETKAGSYHHEMALQWQRGSQLNNSFEIQLGEDGAVNFAGSVNGIPDASIAVSGGFVPDINNMGLHGQLKFNKELYSAAASYEIESNSIKTNLDVLYPGRHIVGEALASRESNVYASGVDFKWDADRDNRARVSFDGTFTTSQTGLHGNVKVSTPIRKITAMFGHNENNGAGQSEADLSWAENKKITLISTYNFGQMKNQKRFESSMLITTPFEILKELRYELDFKNSPQFVNLQHSVMYNKEPITATRLNIRSANNWQEARGSLSVITKYTQDLQTSLNYALTSGKLTGTARGTYGAHSTVVNINGQTTGPRNFQVSLNCENPLIPGRNVVFTTSYDLDSKVVSLRGEMNGRVLEVALTGSRTGRKYEGLARIQLPFENMDVISLAVITTAGTGSNEFEMDTELSWAANQKIELNLDFTVSAGTVLLKTSFPILSKVGAEYKFKLDGEKWLQANIIYNEQSAGLFTSLKKNNGQLQHEARVSLNEEFVKSTLTYTGSATRLEEFSLDITSTHQKLVTIETVCEYTDSGIKTFNILVSSPYINGEKASVSLQMANSAVPYVNDVLVQWSDKTIHYAGQLDAFSMNHISGRGTLTTNVINMDDITVVYKHLFTNGESTLESEVTYGNNKKLLLSYKYGNNGLTVNLNTDCQYIQTLSAEFTPTTQTASYTSQYGTFSLNNALTYNGIFDMENTLNVKTPFDAFPEGSFYIKNGQMYKDYTSDLRISYPSNNQISLQLKARKDKTGFSVVGRTPYGIIRDINIQGHIENNKASITFNMDVLNQRYGVDSVIYVKGPASFAVNVNVNGPVEISLKTNHDMDLTHLTTTIKLIVNKQVSNFELKLNAQDSLTGSVLLITPLKLVNSINLSFSHNTEDVSTETRVGFASTVASYELESNVMITTNGWRSMSLTGAITSPWLTIQEYSVESNTVISRNNYKTSVRMGVDGDDVIITGLVQPENGVAMLSSKLPITGYSDLSIRVDIGKSESNIIMKKESETVFSLSGTLHNGESFKSTLEITSACSYLTKAGMKLHHTGSLNNFRSGVTIFHNKMPSEFQLMIESEKTGPKFQVSIKINPVFVDRMSLVFSNKMNAALNHETYVSARYGENMLSVNTNVNVHSLMSMRADVTVDGTMMKGFTLSYSHTFNSSNSNGLSVHISPKSGEGNVVEFEFNKKNQLEGKLTVHLPYYQIRDAVLAVEHNGGLSLNFNNKVVLTTKHGDYMFGSYLKTNNFLNAGIKLMRPDNEVVDLSIKFEGGLTQHTTTVSATYGPQTVLSFKNSLKIDDNSVSSTLKITSMCPLLKSAELGLNMRKANTRISSELTASVNDLKYSIMTTISMSDVMTASVILEGPFVIFDKLSIAGDVDITRGLVTDLKFVVDDIMVTVKTSLQKSQPVRIQCTVIYQGNRLATFDTHLELNPAVLSLTLETPFEKIREFTLVATHTGGWNLFKNDVTATLNGDPITYVGNMNFQDGLRGEFKLISMSDKVAGLTFTHTGNTKAFNTDIDAMFLGKEFKYFGEFNGEHSNDIIGHFIVKTPFTDFETASLHFEIEHQFRRFQAVAMMLGETLDAKYEFKTDDGISVSGEIKYNTNVVANLLTSYRPGTCSFALRSYYPTPMAIVADHTRRGLVSTDTIVVAYNDAQVLNINSQYKLSWINTDVQIKITEPSTHTVLFTMQNQVTGEQVDAEGKFVVDDMSIVSYSIKGSVGPVKSAHITFKSFKNIIPSVTLDLEAKKTVTNINALGALTINDDEIFRLSTDATMRDSMVDISVIGSKTNYLPQLHFEVSYNGLQGSRVKLTIDEQFGALKIAGRVTPDVDVTLEWDFSSQITPGNIRVTYERSENGIRTSLKSGEYFLDIVVSSRQGNIQLKTPFSVARELALNYAIDNYMAPKEAVLNININREVEANLEIVRTDNTISLSLKSPTETFETLTMTASKPPSGKKSAVLSYGSKTFAICGDLEFETTISGVMGIDTPFDVIRSFTMEFKLPTDLTNPTGSFTSLLNNNRIVDVKVSIQTHQPYRLNFVGTVLHHDAEFEGTVKIQPFALEVIADSSVTEQMKITIKQSGKYSGNLEVSYGSDMWLTLTKQTTITDKAYGQAELKSSHPSVYAFINFDLSTTRGELNVKTPSTSIQTFNVKYSVDNYMKPRNGFVNVMLNNNNEAQLDFLMKEGTISVSLKSPTRSFENMEFSANTKQVYKSATLSYGSKRLSIRGNVVVDNLVTGKIDFETPMQSFKSGSVEFKIPVTLSTPSGSIKVTINDDVILTALGSIQLTPNYAFDFDGKLLEHTVRLGGTFKQTPLEFQIQGGSSLTKEFVMLVRQTGKYGGRFESSYGSDAWVKFNTEVQIANNVQGRFELETCHETVKASVNFDVSKSKGVVALELPFESLKSVDVRYEVDNNKIPAVGFVNFALNGNTQAQMDVSVLGDAMRVSLKSPANLFETMEMAAANRRHEESSATLSYGPKRFSVRGSLVFETVIAGHIEMEMPIESFYQAGITFKIPTTLQNDVAAITVTGNGNVVFTSELSLKTTPHYAFTVETTVMQYTVQASGMLKMKPFELQLQTDSSFTKQFKLDVKQNGDTTSKIELFYGTDMWLTASTEFQMTDSIQGQMTIESSHSAVKGSAIFKLSKTDGSMSITTPFTQFKSFSLRYSVNNERVPATGFVNFNFNGDKQAQFDVSLKNDEMSVAVTSPSNSFETMKMTAANKKHADTSASLSYGSKRFSVRGNILLETTITGKIDIETPFEVLQTSTVEFTIPTQLANPQGSLKVLVNGVTLVTSTASIQLQPHYGITFDGTVLEHSARVSGVLKQQPFEIQLEVDTSATEDFKLVITQKNTYSGECQISYGPNMWIRANADVQLDRDHLIELSVQSSIPKFERVQINIQRTGELSNMRLKANIAYVNEPPFSVTAYWKTQPQIEAGFEINSRYSGKHAIDINVQRSSTGSSYSMNGDVTYNSRRVGRLQGNFNVSPLQGNVHLATSHEYAKEVSFEFTHQISGDYHTVSAKAIYNDMDPFTAQLKVKVDPQFDFEASLNTPLTGQHDVSSALSYNINSPTTRIELMTRYNAMTVGHIVIEAALKPTINGKISLNTGLLQGHSIQVVVQHEGTVLASKVKLHVGVDRVLRFVELEYSLSVEERLFNFDLHTSFPVISQLGVETQATSNGKRLSVKVTHNDKTMAHLQNEVVMTPRFVLKTSINSDSFETISLNLADESRGDVIQGQGELVLLGEKIIVGGIVDLNEKTARVSLQSSFEVAQQVEVSVSYTNTNRTFGVEASAIYNSQTFSKRLNVDKLEGSVEFYMETPFEIMRTMSIKHQCSVSRNMIHTNTLSSLNGDGITVDLKLKRGPAYRIEVNIEIPFVEALKSVKFDGNLFFDEKRIQTGFELTYSHEQKIASEFSVALSSPYATRFELTTPFESVRNVIVEFGTKITNESYLTQLKISHNDKIPLNIKINIVTSPTMSARLQVRTPFTGKMMTSMQLSKTDTSVEFKTNAVYGDRQVFQLNFDGTSQASFAFQLKTIKNIQYELSLDTTDGVTVNTKAQYKNKELSSTFSAKVSPRIEASFTLTTPFIGMENTIMTFKFDQVDNGVTLTFDGQGGRGKSIVGSLSYVSSPKVTIIAELRTPFKTINDIALTMKGMFINGADMEMRLRHNSVDVLVTEFTLTTMPKVDILLKIETPKGHNVLHANVEMTETSLRTSSEMVSTVFGKYAFNGEITTNPATTFSIQIEAPQINDIKADFTVDSSRAKHFKLQGTATYGTYAYATVISFIQSSDVVVTISCKTPHANFRTFGSELSLKMEAKKFSFASKIHRNNEILAETSLDVNADNMFDILFALESAFPQLKSVNVHMSHATTRPNAYTDRFEVSVNGRQFTSILKLALKSGEASLYIDSPFGQKVDISLKAYKLNAHVTYMPGKIVQGSIEVKNENEFSIDGRLQTPFTHVRDVVAQWRHLVSQNEARVTMEVSSSQTRLVFLSFTGEMSPKFMGIIRLQTPLHYLKDVDVTASMSQTGRTVNIETLIKYISKPVFDSQLNLKWKPTMEATFEINHPVSGSVHLKYGPFDGKSVMLKANSRCSALTLSGSIQLSVKPQLEMDIQLETSLPRYNKFAVNGRIEDMANGKTFIATVLTPSGEYSTTTWFKVKPDLEVSMAVNTPIENYRSLESYIKLRKSGDVYGATISASRGEPYVLNIESRFSLPRRLDLNFNLKTPITGLKQIDSEVSLDVSETDVRIIIKGNDHHGTSGESITVINRSPLTMTSKTNVMSEGTPIYSCQHSLKVLPAGVSIQTSATYRTQQVLMLNLHIDMSKSVTIKGKLNTPFELLKDISVNVDSSLPSSIMKTNAEVRVAPWNAMSMSADINMKDTASAQFSFETPFKTLKTVSVSLSHKQIDGHIESVLTTTINKKVYKVKLDYDVERQTRQGSIEINTPYSKYSNMVVSGRYDNDNNAHSVRLSTSLKNKVVTFELNAKRNNVRMSLETPVKGWRSSVLDVGYTQESNIIKSTILISWAQNKRIDIAGSFAAPTSSHKQSLLAQLKMFTPFDIVKAFDINVDSTFSRVGVTTNSRSSLNGKIVYDFEMHLTQDDTQYNAAFTVKAPVKVSGTITVVGVPRDFNIDAQVIVGSATPLRIILVNKFTAQKRLFNIRCVIPTRTVALMTNYEKEAEKMKHQMEVTWDDERDLKIGHSYEITDKKTYSGRRVRMVSRVDTPLRSVELIAAHESKPNSYNHAVGFKWDAAKDESKVIELTNHLDKTGTLLRHQMTFDIPSIRQHVELKNELNMDSANGLLTGRTELQYSENKRETLVLSAKLQNVPTDNSGRNITLELGVSHPGSDVDVLMTSNMADSKRILTAGVSMDYLTINKQKTNLVLRGQIEKLRRRLNLQIKTANKHIAIDGKISETEEGSTIYVVASNQGVGHVSTEIDLNTEDNVLDVKTYYSAGNPKNLLHIFGKFNSPTEMSLVAYRQHNGRRIPEAEISTEMRSKRLMRSKFYWRPNMAADIKHAIGEVSESVASVSSDVYTDVHSDILREVRMRRSLYQTASLRPYTQLWNQESAMLDADIRVVQQEWMRMLSANDFYVRDIQRFVVASFEKISSVLGQWTEAITRHCMNVVRECRQFCNDVAMFAGSSAKLISSSLDTSVQFIDTKIKRISARSQELQNIMVHEMSNALDEVVEAVSMVIEKYIDVHSNMVVYSQAFITKCHEIVSDMFTRVKSSNAYISFVNTIDSVRAMKYVHVAVDRLMAYTDHVIGSYMRYAKHVADMVLDQLHGNFQRSDVDFLWNSTAEYGKQVFAAYKSLEVERNTRKFIDVLVDGGLQLTKKNVIYLTDEWLHLDKDRVITYDPQNGEIELETYIPMEMPTLKTIKVDFSKFTRAIDDAKVKLTNLVPNWDPYYVSDLYYQYKPSSDVTNWVPPFKGYASISGQHIETFDGTHYDFISPCSYLLVSDFAHRRFSIVVENTGNKRGVTGRSMLIKTDDSSFKIHSTGKVNFNGRPSDLPLSTGKTTVTRVGSEIIVNSEHGFTLTCDLDVDVCSLELSGWYFGKTGGLFGTYNNERNDDWTTSDNRRVDDVEAFARSWEVGKRCITTQNIARQVSAPIPAICKEFFMSNDSPLRPCFKVVDPAPYIKMCADDVAADKRNVGDKSSACSAAKLYQQKCRSNEVHVHVPKECVRCQIGTTTSYTQENTVGLTQLEKSADVLFVVEEKACNRDVVKHVQTIAVKLEVMALRNKDFKNNRFGLIGFGGNGVHSEGHAHTLDGALLSDARSFKRGVANLNIDSTVEESTNHNARSALELAASYPLRAGSAKMVVLVTCSESATDVSGMEAMFRERGMVLHVLNSQTFRENTVAGSSYIFGVDSVSAFTADHVNNQNMVGNATLRVNIPAPSGESAALALSTRGSVFDVEHLNDGRVATQKRFVDVFVRRLATTTEVPECQTCRCDATGISICTPCNN